MTQISTSYEIVKTVKGQDIIRRKGTKFPYFLVVKGSPFNGEAGAFYDFKTCKAATEFINKLF